MWYQLLRVYWKHINIPLSFKNNIQIPCQFWFQRTSYHNGKRSDFKCWIMGTVSWPAVSAKGFNKVEAEVVSYFCWAVVQTYSTYHPRFTLMIFFFGHAYMLIRACHLHLKSGSASLVISTRKLCSWCTC